MHSRHHSFFTYLQFYIFTYQYIFYLYNYKIISNCETVVTLNSLTYILYVAFIFFFNPLKGNYLPKTKPQ